MAAGGRVVTLRRMLSALTSAPSRETPMPTRTRRAPTRSPHPQRRVHVDGSRHRDRWTYRPAAEGWVIDGLPDHNRDGQPAGISLDTIHRLWPIRAADLRRAVNPAEAESDRLACRYRTVR